MEIVAPGVLVRLSPSESPLPAGIIAPIAASQPDCAIHDAAAQSLNSPVPKSVMSVKPSPFDPTPLTSVTSYHFRPLPHPSHIPRRVPRAR